MKLDSILKGFNKTLAQLNKLEQRNAVKVEKNAEVINKLGGKNAALEVESERAAKVRAKIEALVN